MHSGALLPGSSCIVLQRDGWTFISVYVLTNAFLTVEVTLCGQTI